MKKINILFTFSLIFTTSLFSFVVKDNNGESVLLVNDENVSVTGKVYKLTGGGDKESGKEIATHPIENCTGANQAIGWEDNIAGTHGRSEYNFMCKDLTHHLKRLCSGVAHCPAVVECHYDEIAEPIYDEVGYLEITQEIIDGLSIQGIVKPKDDATQVMSCGIQMNPFSENQTSNSAGCFIDLEANNCHFWNYSGEAVVASCNALVEYRKITALENEPKKVCKAWITENDHNSSTYGIENDDVEYQIYNISDDISENDKLMRTYIDSVGNEQYFLNYHHYTGDTVKFKENCEIVSNNGNIRSKDTGNLNCTPGFVKNINGMDYCYSFIKEPTN